MCLTYRTLFIEDYCIICDPNQDTYESDATSKYVKTISVT